MLIAFTSVASAQFSTYPRTTEPAYWVSGGVGAFNGQAVHDGATQSTWDFGQRTSWQYRASIEKAIQNQSSIGIVGTFVHVPITYSDNIANTLAECPTSGCSSAQNRCGRCAAHIDMIGLAALFHAGGGTGLSSSAPDCNRSNCVSKPKTGFQRVTTHTAQAEHRRQLLARLRIRIRIVVQQRDYACPGLRNRAAREHRAPIGREQQEHGAIHPNGIALWLRSAAPRSETALDGLPNVAQRVGVT